MSNLIVSCYIWLEISHTQFFTELWTLGVTSLMSGSNDSFSIILVVHFCEGVETPQRSQKVPDLSTSTLKWLQMRCWLPKHGYAHGGFVLCTLHFILLPSVIEQIYLTLSLFYTGIYTQHWYTYVPKHNQHLFPTA